MLLQITLVVAGQALVRSLLFVQECVPDRKIRFHSLFLEPGERTLLAVRLQCHFSFVHDIEAGIYIVIAVQLSANIGMDGRSRCAFLDNAEDRAAFPDDAEHRQPDRLLGLGILGRLHRQVFPVHRLLVSGILLLPVVEVDERTGSVRHEDRPFSLELPAPKKLRKEIFPIGYALGY